MHAELMIQALSACAWSSEPGTSPPLKAGAISSGYSWFRFGISSPCTCGNGEPSCDTLIASRS